MHFHERIALYFKNSLKVVSNWKYLCFNLDNGLATDRRQAIIWTNTGPILWRIYVALRGDELMIQVMNILFCPIFFSALCVCGFYLILYVIHDVASVVLLCCHALFSLRLCFSYEMIFMWFTIEVVAYVWLQQDWIVSMPVPIDKSALVKILA